MEKLAKSKGFTENKYIGIFEGLHIFLVSNKFSGGKVGFPNYIAAINGKARLLDYNERKTVTLSL